MLEQHENWTAIKATLSINKPLSLNHIDSIRNEYTELLNQFPELTRPTAKGETVKQGITHKIVTKGHPAFARPRRLAPDKLVTAKHKLRLLNKALSSLATANGHQRFTWFLKKR